MKHMMKKIMALLLAVVLVAGVLPASSAAPVAGFPDVHEGDWYAPYVRYVYDHQLMNGTEKGFEPEGSCTRAMAAVVLYRASGDPRPQGKTTFTDLDPDMEWYQDGILWAQQKGVVNGVGGNRFDPDGILTRDQLVTMMWRYNGRKIVHSDYLSPFPDRDDIDDWAREAFKWAISKRVIGGSNGKLIPKESATRAQFAKIVSVYDEEEEKSEENRIVAGCMPESLRGDFPCTYQDMGQGDEYVNKLINDYGIMVMDRTGTYVKNDAVVRDMTVSRDGRTFTVTIRDNLKYNDGTPITAADYVFSILISCSPASPALGIYSRILPVIEGGESYFVGRSTCMSGLDMHRRPGETDPYTFSVTFSRQDNVHYYFADTYLSVQPMNVKFWLGEDYNVDFIDASEVGCAVTDRDHHPVSLQAADIQKHFEDARNSGTGLLSAGPYMVEEWDPETPRCILKRNPNYAGNFEGQKPFIKTIEVVCADDERWGDQLTTGEIDVYPNVVWKGKIDQYLSLTEENPDLSYVSHYHAGYGRIQFLCDIGPTQFPEVRKAVARFLDRDKMGASYSGEGRYEIVNGPFATCMKMYQDSEALLAEALDPYEYNVDEAIRELYAGGWTLDENGREWTGPGLRCKDVTNLEGCINTEGCKRLADGRLLMPLKIKWYTTESSDDSRMIKMLLAESDIVKEAGLVIEETVGDWEGIQKVLMHKDAAGNRLKPEYGMVNLDTTWTSSIYDYSYNWSNDPEYVNAGFNDHYLFDSRDRDLDAISKEMVFRPMPGDYATFLSLWQEYVIRWNEVLPDIPLYAEGCYTAIPARLKGYEDNYFWTFPYAILYAELENHQEHVRENKITVGCSSRLEGNFGASFIHGNYADTMVSDLINDYGTYYMRDDGSSSRNNATVYAEGGSADGQFRSFEIRQGLRYNNGEPITAKDYAMWILFCCSPAAVDLGIESDLYKAIAGGDEFRKGETDSLRGLQVLDDYNIEINVTREYYNYFFTDNYLSSEPMNAKFWLGDEFDVMQTEEGCAIAQNMDPLVVDGELIGENFRAAAVAGNKIVSAGPYMIDTWDPETAKCVLKRNPNYAGNNDGAKPSIETIEVVYTVGDAWKEQLKTGEIDVFPELTQKQDIDAYLEMMDADPSLSCVAYDRAGYGKIHFLCDVGPTQFEEVRRAIARLLDRDALATAFCGEGRYKIVNGPYATDMAMYRQSWQLLDETLDPYEFNVEKANKELDDGGWTLNERGEPWNGTGLRYKNVTDLVQYINMDGCKRLENGTILMPLKIKWYATDNNQVSDLLKAQLVDSQKMKDAGIEIEQTVGSMDGVFTTLYREDIDGNDVPAEYGMVNIGASWTSADYDCSGCWGYNGGNDEGYNDHYLYDSQDGDLNQLSKDMVWVDVMGDYGPYLDNWQKYIIRWNEVLPDIPLYTNTYFEAVPAWLDGYRPNDMWGFQQAIIYASIEGTR